MFWYSRLIQKVIMKLRPDFTKAHKEMFHKIMALRKEVLGITDKKTGQFASTIGVRLKVLKFIKILKKKRDDRRVRKSTMGVTLAKQAYEKLQHNEMAVGKL